jgi:hypothetical protein
MSSPTSGPFRNNKFVPRWIVRLGKGRLERVIYLLAP